VSRLLTWRQSECSVLGVFDTPPVYWTADTFRGRCSARPSGESRELAILATAERLLSERPLAEISIDDLAQGAGISRSGFLFYFQSKEAVLLALAGPNRCPRPRLWLPRPMLEADRAFASGAASSQEWRRRIGAS